MRLPTQPKKRKQEADEKHKQEEAFLSRSLRVTLLVVEDHANRPSDGKRLRDIEAGVTTDMHGRLGEAHRRSVARVHAATVYRPSVPPDMV